jgi:hypothetical protein
MALYRVHSRLFDAPASQTAEPAGACPVCARVVDADGVAHRSARLHPGCHSVVAAVEPLGSAGFERLRSYLWPDTVARKDQGRRRKA